MRTELAVLVILSGLFSTDLVLLDARVSKAVLQETATNAAKLRKECSVWFQKVLPR
jgi:hypothetical protein